MTSFFCSASISVILVGLAICDASFAAEIPKCAQNLKPEKSSHAFFDSAQKLCAAEIFSDSLRPKEVEALQAYNARKKIANGKIYGESVRRYRLAGKTRQQVERDMAKRGCPMKQEFLREGGNGPARKDANGKEIPLLMFLCPDGGVLRIKPEGDPGSKYRPQPHGSKALRFPADAPYSTFDDEVLKVDESGNAVPKAPNGLQKLFSDEKSQAELVEGWADDAHSDLGTN
jgi:hypothetical protein